MGAGNSYLENCNLDIFIVKKKKIIFSRLITTLLSRIQTSDEASAFEANQVIMDYT